MEERSGIGRDEGEKGGDEGDISAAASVRSRCQKGVRSGPVLRFRGPGAEQEPGPLICYLNFVSIFLDAKSLMMISISFLFYNLFHYYLILFYTFHN